MQQHPGGHPGHPMGAPGMVHNPSQPGAQPGMPPQMAAHMAVSGPGGQVNPALMGGMPPGAGGPNAHAMQHLNPQAFQQQQQQQYAMAQNPSMLAMQQQQQRLLHQRQLALQSQMYGGMNPMQMGQMNAAQFQAMRQNANLQRVGIPQHLQQAVHMGQQGQHPNQMLAQQLAIQQHQQHQAQQHAANQQMHQGNQPGHPGQMTPQQLQSMQQAQIAQAQAQSMAQQQVPQGVQNQQPQNQPQPQPQPQTAQQPTPQAQQQQAQQQAQQQQAQQPQSGPQQAQQTQPNQQGPQRAPTPAQQANQAQNQPQQPQQQAQPSQQPQGQPQPQQQQAQQPQPNPQLLAHQQLANLQHMQQQQQQQHFNNENVLKGHWYMKLMQFTEHLSAFPSAKSKDDLAYWQNLVSTFFSARGVYRLSVVINGPDGEPQTDKQYEIAQPALARYFHTHFQGGIEQIQMTFKRGMIDKSLPNGGHFMENNEASMIYWFENSHVVATGSLRARFDHEQKLDLLEFVTKRHEEYVSRKIVLDAARPQHMWVKDWKRMNGMAEGQESSMSPEMNKKGKTKQYKTPQTIPPDLDLPGSSVKSNYGITDGVLTFLEIVEVLGQMNPLFSYFHENPGLSPYTALNDYVSTNITNGGPQQQQAAVNGVLPAGNSNGPQNNPRTPSFSHQFHPHVGASPATQHLQLPNSPHMVGSPAQGHMQAPGMQVQQSQQGGATTNSSSGPSANTSPASNKRRRPSTVKAEEEGGGGGGAPTPASMGGPQVVNGVGMANKKPPTPRMPKRQKGNPA
ncbi:LIM-domain binding protein-domain-containing protein [Xylariaceae sp. FL0804]|nr:LIM-domain binding protein-domain-containing protein [Xylariaceae sp. FL0804]